MRRAPSSSNSATSGSALAPPRSRSSSSTSGAASATRSRASIALVAVAATRMPVSLRRSGAASPTTWSCGLPPASRLWAGRSYGNRNAHQGGAAALFDRRIAAQGACPRRDRAGDEMGYGLGAVVFDVEADQLGIAGDPQAGVAGLVCLQILLMPSCDSCSTAAQRRSPMPSAPCMSRAMSTSYHCLARRSWRRRGASINSLARAAVMEIAGETAQIANHLGRHRGQLLDFGAQGIVGCRFQAQGAQRRVQADVGLDSAVVQILRHGAPFAQGRHRGHAVEQIQVLNGGQDLGHHLL